MISAQQAVLRNIENLFSCSVIVLLFSQMAASSAFSRGIEMVGSPKAKTQVIYLYGANTLISEKGELENGRRLARIAEKLNLFIVFPKSNTRYPPEVDRFFHETPTYCWEG